MDKKPVNYVSNKELYPAMCEYNEKRKYAEENELPPPKIPDTIGLAIWMIAERLSSKACFANYSYRDDMVADGVFFCIKYGVNSFNSEKYNNPFAYFTQIIKTAFLRRIEAEQMERYLKIKNMGKLMSEDELASLAETTSYSNEIMDDFVREFEAKIERKKEKKRQRKLEMEAATESINE